MKKSTFIFPLWLLLTLSCYAQKPSCDLVPGWKQDGELRHFTAENLFEYMDGNAEGYVIYEFVQMYGVTCKQGEVTLVFDVSEMAGPEFAYGIFAANRDPRQPVEKIGLAAQITGRRGVFCKDKYYVELAANPEGDHSAIIRQFLKAMEPRIPGQVRMPDIVSWFPREQLDETTLRLVPQSVLGLSLLRRGYIAQYPYGRMFIVPEESAEAAAAVLKKAQARMGESAQPVNIGDGGFRATDKYLGQVCFFRKGRYVAGIVAVPESEDPVARARVLANRIP